MCTAITYHNGDHYFGRNLDLEYAYQESVTVTPRNDPFRFRKAGELPRHYAMIGMAYVQDGYPLYYDAVNEQGLAMAGLNFPDNAVYRQEDPEKDNVTPFEFIPWVLGQCADLQQAKKLLERINLWDSPYSEALPLSPLHWIIADKESAITVEAMEDGLHVSDNPVGVLTNNPPFDFMMHYLSCFRDQTAAPSKNRFSDKIDLPVYCVGIGAIGLPGDYSSPSRFVKAAFLKLNSVAGQTESESVSQFFHILSGVEMPRGCVRLGENVYDITVYSACCNQDKGIYYYVTYDSRQIRAVDLYREDLEGRELVSYALEKAPGIAYQN